MKLEHRQLSLHNVIQFSADLDKSKPRFEQIDEAGEYFKKILMSNGYYTSGPIVFSYNPEAVASSLNIMTTIGNKVEIVEDSLEHFGFIENFMLDTNYWYRHYDITEEIPYKAIEEQIVGKNKKINTIYHVILKFYGETMIDLYYDVEDF